MNKCARDALFGMSKLPEKSGGWGRLLRSGKMPPELEPASAKAIQSINDSFLVFAQGVSASRRGFAFVLGFVIGCAGVSMILADIVVGNLLSSPNFWPSAAAAYGVLLLIACCFFAWSAVSVLRPMAPPVVLSRRHRHFYSWLGPKAGWVITNYDEVQPVSMVSRSYSLAGAATGYVLAIVDCDDSDRRVRALTEEERLAYSGKLRSLNRRWALLGFISTVIVLMMFAVLGIPPWFSDSKF